MYTFTHLLYFYVFAFVFSLLTGCSIFFGNIPAAQEKSKTYTITDLSKTSPKWKKIIKRNPGLNSPDHVFQSLQDHSIISINSKCKTAATETESSEKKLKDLTRELISGVLLKDPILQEKGVFKKTPFIKSTFFGEFEENKIQAIVIVFEKNKCIYDLMYISSKKYSEENKNDFGFFCNSLKFN